MQLLEKNILTTLLCFVALTQTTLTASNSASQPFHTRRENVQGKRDWKRDPLLSQNLQIRTQHTAQDIEMGAAAAHVAVCNAKNARNKKWACFCATTFTVVASAAACAAVVVTKHHVGTL